MKHVFLFTFILFLCSSKDIAQVACSNLIIQSPVVSKPTEGQSSPEGTCDVVRVSWKGRANQAYLVNARYIDPVTGIITSTVLESPIRFDNNYNCYAILPAKPSSFLSWSVQAIQKIDGRIFHSYPLRGEYPGCNVSNIITKNPDSDLKRKSDISTAKDVLTRNQLMVYPNPVTGELTINWGSSYKGHATLTIMDVSGKTVKKINTRKDSGNYTNEVNVRMLSPGLYFLNVRTKNGESFTTKFVKE